MRTMIAGAVLAAGFMTLPALAPNASAAVVEARVDLSEQRMHVYQHGVLRYTWPVSTARRGKVTPTGAWTAKWASKNHRSSRYGGAPMPYSIFYSGNFAIHGTDQIKRLGRPASAGCVRLHPDNARVFFNMAHQVGLKNVKVRVKH
jgi:lipoprotein-anchoring transpeptidase ErfK/SrfK